MYTVTFFNSDGIDTYSRSFDTIKAARKWCNWLAAQSFVQSARIMQGGVGGMEVQ